MPSLLSICWGAPNVTMLRCAAEWQEPGAQERLGCMALSALSIENGVRLAAGLTSMLTSRVENGAVQEAAGELAAFID